VIASLTCTYHQLIATGLPLNLLLLIPAQKKGRVKQTKPRTCLIGFNVMWLLPRFLSDFRVPFTNNGLNKISE